MGAFEYRQAEETRDAFRRHRVNYLFIGKSAPDGIERFAGAWGRRTEVDGFPVCSIDDIVASKQATGRQKDRETLPRLIQFRDWLKRRATAQC